VGAKISDNYDNGKIDEVIINNYLRHFMV